jgi:hypothetical protein
VGDAVVARNCRAMSRRDTPTERWVPTAGDGHLAGLQRLAQIFKDAAPKFREFVEKEDPIVGEAHLPRPRIRAAADEPSVAHGVVRSAKRATAHERLTLAHETNDRVNPGRLQSLLWGEQR